MRVTECGSAIGHEGKTFAGSGVTTGRGLPKKQTEEPHGGGGRRRELDGSSRNTGKGRRVMLWTKRKLKRKAFPGPASGMLLTVEHAEM